MKYLNRYISILGLISLASDGKSLTGLWFGGQKYYMQTLDKNYIEKELEIFDLTKKWLNIYFKGQNPDFKIPVKYEGSEFRKEIFKILEDIPYGKTMTYGDIAKIIAKDRNIKTMSSQAVGSGISHNPISIIIPCHRIIGKNNFIGGYAGGIERKLKLLEFEGIDIEKIRIKK